MEIKRIIDSVWKYKYVVIIVFAGVLLMNFPSINKGKTNNSEFYESKFNIDDFESRIEKSLVECEGVGRAKVILSIDSGPESVYAKEAKKSQREQKEGTVESDSDMKPSIISEGSGKESPVKIKELYPKFRGALVICDGADEAGVRKTVVDSISALTGLGADSISVIKMKALGGK